MTLNLPDAEMAELDRIAFERDMSKIAVVRQALRLMRAFDERASKGGRIIHETAEGERLELVSLA
jgi:predicted transcriptional regulator